MQDYRKLKVWKPAHDLTVKVYRLTKKFPADERFGLTSQMRRCAVSIPANIAEGSGRGSRKDFVRFLRIASGSSNELEYFFILCMELGLIPDDDCQELRGDLADTRRMLAGLIHSIETNV
ncbi:MAG: four helix bundle protein [Phycisphaerae bacterium]